MKPEAQKVAEGLEAQLANCKNPDPYMCVIARECSRWGDDEPCLEVRALLQEKAGE